MKAYKAYEKGSDYSTIVFAENCAMAKIVASCTDVCEDAEWINIRVNRYSKADSLYKGKREIDWDDPETRIALVKDFGWQCDDTSFECDDCPAKEWCGMWEEERGREK